MGQVTQVANEPDLSRNIDWAWSHRRGHRPVTKGLEVCEGRGKGGSHFKQGSVMMKMVFKGD